MARINFSENIGYKTNIIKNGFPVDNQPQTAASSHKDNNTFKENNDSDLSFKNLESDIDSKEIQLNELENSIIEEENNLEEIKPSSLEEDNIVENYDVDSNGEQTPSLIKRFFMSIKNLFKN